MRILNPDDKIPTSWKKSIFLAGPSKRGSKIGFTEWRQEACDILKRLDFDGVVFVPEPFMKEGYEAQVDWENECLNMADVILFWIPRNEDLPGFTTNVEYGEWMKSGKIVLGCPDDAKKVDYLKYKAKQQHTPIANTLPKTIDECLKKIGDGALRKDGERYVPIEIWNTKPFQNWYEDMKEVGNELSKATVEWTFRVGKNKEKIFSTILFVDILIKKENRHKINEFIFSRTDIASVVAYRKYKYLEDTDILLVKEFRSPCSNKEGYVYEIPGGSSKDSNEPMENVVAKELEEETGLKINKNRFSKVESRQLAATLSTHKSHLYKVELTEDEMDNLKNTKVTFGQEQDTEKTYVVIKSLKDIFKDNLLDWSNIGMICQVLNTNKPIEKKADWVGQFLGNK